MPSGLFKLFGDGLASVFPGTRTVESDFSVLGWEKNVHRACLSDLALDGILHSKQRAEIADLQELLHNSDLH